MASDSNQDTVSNARSAMPRPSVGGGKGNPGHAELARSNDGLSNTVVFSLAGLVGVVGGGMMFMFVGGSQVGGPTAAVAKAGAATTAVARAKSAQKDGYTSMVDGECAVGWVAGQSNVDQMYCYMTTYIDRLCDKEERRHFLETVERFEKDYKVFDKRFHAAAMTQLVGIQANAMQIGIEGARITRSMNDPNASGEEVAKQFDRMQKLQTMTGNPHTVTAEKPNSIGYYKLEIEMARLASLGYLSPADFAKTKAKWVIKAFNRTEPVKSACSN